MKSPAILVVAIFTLASCSNGDTKVIRVGSKDFIESIIIAEIVTQFLNAHKIPAVHKKALGGTEVLWGALKNGDIDIYAEYSGTIEKEILNSDSQFAKDHLVDTALARYGVGKSASLGFNDAYALGMLESKAEQLKVKTISDLSRHKSLRLVFSNEFLNRQDGYIGLKEKYAFPQLEARGILHSYAYFGLINDAFDVTDIYTTDAETLKYKVRVLDDDLGFFPRYDALLLYRLDSPKIPEQLSLLANTISEGEMIRLNSQILSDGDSEFVVASRFLKDKFKLEPRYHASGVLNRLLRNALDHLKMVVVSLLIALMVGLPLGLWAARRKYAGKVIFAVVGVIQTIPSLALLVFMLPLFGIGTLPAIIALFLYSLLPIVRQTANGINGINRELRDSARVIGLTNAAVLFRIEIPLASRDILAGVKTATILNIGTAVLGALIGAGGFGEAILTGIRLNDPALTLQGALPAALMALMAQWLFDALDHLLVPKGLRISLAGD